MPWTGITAGNAPRLITDISDEFIPPTRIGSGCKIQNGDSLFFINFRADRVRQLTEAFVKETFTGFQRTNRPVLTHFVSMTQYAADLHTESAFPPLTLHNTFSEVISREGLSQLKIAETEKYAHVTWFFNGGCEQRFPREERILIPSPSVATYDLLPQMSAPELTDQLVQAIHHDEYDVIICNYANADMVGHSGNFSATVEAIECLDLCMQKTGKAVEQKGGHLLITADHGNAEAMFNDSTGQAHTAHTSQPVPFLYVGEGWHFRERSGSLVDIAPTLLTLLGLEVPNDMTGIPLLAEDHVNPD